MVPVVMVVVIARAKLDLAAALDRQCAVAVKFKLKEPVWSLGQLLRAQEEHRFDERCSRVFLRHRSLSITPWIACIQIRPLFWRVARAIALRNRPEANRRLGEDDPFDLVWTTPRTGGVG